MSRTLDRSRKCRPLTANGGNDWKRRTIAGTTEENFPSESVFKIDKSPKVLATAGGRFNELANAPAADQDERGTLFSLHD